MGELDLNILLAPRRRWNCPRWLRQARFGKLRTIQQALAVLTPPSALPSAVSCGTRWRTQGAWYPECNSFPIRAGVEVREPDRLEERRRQGWKVEASGRVGEGETKVQIEAGWGFRFSVSGGTEQSTYAPLSSAAEMNEFIFVLNGR